MMLCKLLLLKKEKEKNKTIKYYQTKKKKTHNNATQNSQIHMDCIVWCNLVCEYKRKF